MNEFPENENREEEANAEVTEAEKNEPAEPQEENEFRYSPTEVADASYMPRDEAPRTPRTYSYSEPLIPEKPEKEEKSKKKKGMGTGAVIALCILCALLGTVGGVLGSGALRGNAAEPEEPYAAETPVMTEESDAIESTEIPEEEAVVVENPRLAPESEIREQLAAMEIYEIACRQVVGISTEVSYHTYFGTSSGTVTGSGFIISSDGYILTNFHVVEYAAEGKYPITVMLYNGDSYPATIVGYEGDDSDVAVLKINAEDLDAVRLGDSDDMRVGETIFAVGNPLGELDYTMTRGMISAMDREISTGDDDSTINMFQIDAAVNSGNSGGPVYNMRGEVIGIVTAKYSDTYEEMGIEGLGFAIPIDDASVIAKDLIENGYVRGKAYMGVSTKSVSAAAAQYYNMVEGAYVYAVVQGSAAEAAGIHMGDIVIGVDHTPVASVSDLQAALKNYKAGEEAEIRLFREGEETSVTIVFDEKQPDPPQSPIEEDEEYDDGYGYGRDGRGGYDDSYGYNSGFPFGSFFW